MLNEDLSFVYDIETYKNFFCVTFSPINNKNKYIQFVYSDKISIQEFRDTFEMPELLGLDDLKSFISNKELNLIGYNSSNYDDLLLKVILYSEHCSNSVIYRGSQKIITNEQIRFKLKYEDKFKPKWNFSIDLFEVLSAGERRKSLKELGINLNWYKVQDLPYKFDELLDKDQMKKVLLYNMNDVNITQELFHNKTVNGMVQLRIEMQKEYGISLTCSSDSNMADRILLKMYSKVEGLKPSLVKEMRTNRKEIKLTDVIFDFIEYKNDYLKKFLKELKNITLKTTTSINKFGKKSIRIDSYPLEHELEFSDLKVKFASGGIHSIDGKNFFEDNDKYTIIDADIQSYYPSLILLYGIIPDHLSERFFKLYQTIKEDRVKAKESGKKVKADGLKILLNSVTGKLNYNESWLYDPQAYLRITVNGQLIILMIIEELIDKGFKILSVNTDGLTSFIERNRIEEFKEVFNRMEKKTGLLFEYNSYKKYWRKDVNNYIVLTEEGKKKRKGFFENDTIRAKADALIIRESVENYILYDTPVEQTIRECKNLHSFCFYFKNRKEDQFRLKCANQDLPKTNRFYKSIHGDMILKERLKDRKEGKDTKSNKKGYITSVSNGKNVKICNEIIDSSIIPSDPDYNFYIKEALKVLRDDSLKYDVSQLSLW